MKAETKGVIDKLQECEVETIMATGDNVHTAISVANQCGIIRQEGAIWLGDLQIDEDTDNRYIVWENEDFTSG